MGVRALAALVAAVSLWSVGSAAAGGPLLRAIAAACAVLRHAPEPALDGDDQRITLASGGVAARPGYAVDRVGVDVTLRY